jgi:serine protease AprX
MPRFCLSFLLVFTVLSLCIGAVSATPMTAERRAEILAHVRPEEVFADTDANRVFDNLEAKLARVREDEPLDVIVRFQPGREGAATWFAERVTRVMELDRSVAARLTAGEIRRLAASDAVESIEMNAICTTGRDTSQSSFGVTKARMDFGYTGNADGNANTFSAADIVIAIVDTGLDPQHPDLANNKVIASADFINNRTGAYDDNGHGTHCGSIAAGALNMVGTQLVGGVAPGAALVSVKVLNAQGSGTFDQIVAGIDWCIQNRQQFGIEILSLSVQSRGTSDGTDAFSRAVDRAAANGLAVCIIAGNFGPRRLSIGPGGAAVNGITVGNIADTGKGGFSLFSSSSRGPTADGRIKPDICAPGVSILAAQANSTGYIRMTGTSMACPFAAGVVALLLQALPALTPSQVKSFLKNTAEHWGPIENRERSAFFAGGDNNEYGAGRVDAYLALAIASGQTGAPPATPTHRYGEGVLTGRGASQTWIVTVRSSQFPLAITMLVYDLAADFDITVLAPDRRMVFQSFGESRQETIGVTSPMLGDWTVIIDCYEGPGSYSLDVSSG